MGVELDGCCCWAWLGSTGSVNAWRAGMGVSTQGGLYRRVSLSSEARGTRRRLPSSKSFSPSYLLPSPTSARARAACPCSSATVHNMLIEHFACSSAFSIHSRLCIAWVRAHRQAGHHQNGRQRRFLPHRTSSGMESASYTIRSCVEYIKKWVSMSRLEASRETAICIFLE